MKHLKEIVLEKKDMKSYKKYIPIINAIFKDIIELEEKHTIVYEENNQIEISIKTWERVEKKFFTFCLSKFGNINYYIIPSNGHQLIIQFFNVPIKALQDFETEIMSKKYNL